MTYINKISEIQLCASENVNIALNEELCMHIRFHCLKTDILLNSTSFFWCLDNG